jgi:hypothetical protein
MVVTGSGKQHSFRRFEQMETMPHHPHGRGPHPVIPGGKAAVE